MISTDHWRYGARTTPHIALVNRKPRHISLSLGRIHSLWRRADGSKRQLITCYFKTFDRTPCVLIKSRGIVVTHAATTEVPRAGITKGGANGLMFFHAQRSVSWFLQMRFCFVSLRKIPKPSRKPIILSDGDEPWRIDQSHPYSM